MKRRIVILFLIVIFTLLLTISAFALTKEERAWKEDILTLLPMVKRVGDYSEMVDLIEVAPALKKDPEIIKAFVTFAPPGAIPPEWAREEKGAPPAIREVSEKIVTAEAQKEKERREMKEEEARRIAREVAIQRKVREREAAPPEVIKEAPKLEAPRAVELVTEGPPEKIATAAAVRKAREQQRARQKEAEGIEEALGVIPTPLPPGTKIIHSTDVISGVKAEMVEGRAKVIITLSGARKYTVSERSRPASVIINIPHTINAVYPRRIMVNRGCVRMIEVTQHHSTPFDETRIKVILNRGTEYQVTHKDNEIYIDFEK
ncbi:AMIN domain-containing protein [bacterium]|nr:AMIN domain-containing protein [bacterium]